MGRAPFPFDDDSRTGLELELLMPRGRSRADLASALARALSASVRTGLKLHAAPVDGRPAHDLTPTFVVERQGERLLEIVDDVTITADLDRAAPTAPGFFRAVVDDARLALLAERTARADVLDVDRVLAPYLSVWGGRLLSPGEPPAADAAHRAGVDPAGQTIAVVAKYDGGRERVAEIVTAPLRRRDRARAVAEILRVAREEGAFIPEEAALHAHLDAGPWRSVARMRQLLLDTDAVRDLLMLEWEPNPRCKRLGRFDPRMVARARAARPDETWPDFTRDLLASGATKYVDVNVLGVIHPRPRQPTLEVRALPMSLDADVVLARVEKAERFFAEIARTADASTTEPLPASTPSSSQR